MFAKVEKAKENKCRVVTNSISKKKSSGKQSVGFVDNRPEVVAQRKFQEITNNNPPVKLRTQLHEMADNHSAHQQQQIQKNNNIETMDLHRNFVCSNHMRNAAIQRWEIPDFSGPNHVNGWSNLPPTTFQNNQMITTGIYIAPRENEADIAGFKAGENAINTPFSMDVYAARGGMYERSHLITRIFGGPGVADNIIPLLQTLNADIYNNIEGPIMNARRKIDKRFFHMKVTVDYGGHSNPNLTVPEQALASQLRYELTEKHYKGSGDSKDSANWADAGTGNLIPSGHRIKVHDLSGLAPAQQNEMAQQGVVRGAFRYHWEKLKTILTDKGVHPEAVERYKDLVKNNVYDAASTRNFMEAFTTNAIQTFIDNLECNVESTLQLLDREIENGTLYRDAIKKAIQLAERVEATTANGLLPENLCRALEERLNNLNTMCQNSRLVPMTEDERWIVPCELMAEIIHYFDHRDEEIPEIVPHPEEIIPVSEEKAQKQMRELLMMMIKRSG